MSVLPDFDVTITMNAVIDGARHTRSFTVRIPCVDVERAHDAGYLIGDGINTGSDHLWKTGDVTARSATPTEEQH